MKFDQLPAFASKSPNGFAFRAAFLSRGEKWANGFETQSSDSKTNRVHREQREVPRQTFQWQQRNSPYNRQKLVTTFVARNNANIERQRDDEDDDNNRHRK